MKILAQHWVYHFIGEILFLHEVFNIHIYAEQSTRINDSFYMFYQGFRYGLFSLCFIFTIIHWALFLLFKNLQNDPNFSCLHIFTFPPMHSSFWFRFFFFGNFHFRVDMWDTINADLIEHFIAFNIPFLCFFFFLPYPHSICKIPL